MVDVATNKTVTRESCKLSDRSPHFAHLGSSDHCSVHWVPNPNYGSSKLMAKKKVVKMCRFPESALNAFGRWVSAHSWFAHTCAIDYLPVDSLTTSFSDDLCNAINIYFPDKSVKIHPTDKPWMSAEIKSLILERQRAYHSGSNERWRLLRNKVRMAICKRKKEFFARKVKSLKTSDMSNSCNVSGPLANESIPLKHVQAGGWRKSGGVI